MLVCFGRWIQELALSRCSSCEIRSQSRTTSLNAGFTVTIVHVSGAINHVLFVYKFSQLTKVTISFKQSIKVITPSDPLSMTPKIIAIYFFPPLSSLCITFKINRSTIYSYNIHHSTSATNHRPRIHASLRSMDLMVYYGPRTVVSRRMS